MAYNNALLFPHSLVCRSVGVVALLQAADLLVTGTQLLYVVFG